ncbi:MAG: class I SAM-dependent methyltransferase [Desulfobacterales bacterium]|nr:class I SAM-dependent methyltransferase [Desulfobacterales bacterium]
MHKINFTKHNWLIYKHARKWLSAWTPHIRGTVYDLGCGERQYEDFILQHADKYIGVDWSKTFHPLKADIITDLNKPFPMIEDGSADTVFSVSVMEHLCEPQCFLNESFRILKHSGIILLQVPFQWHVHEAPYDYFRYTEFGLEYMLAKSGFVKIKVTPSSGFWSTMALKVNYQSLRYVGGVRPLHFFLRVAAIPFWFSGQYIAYWLDKIDYNRNETAGYTVVAHKP